MDGRAIDASDAGKVAFLLSGPVAEVAAVPLGLIRSGARLRNSGYDVPVDLKAHWERVYTTKASEELSWFEPEPAKSLQLLERSGLTAAT